MDRETQILSIASEQFGTYGFSATSVQTVAKLAGISKPLIYNYFGSKEGLYEACLDRGGALLADEIERIARGDAVGLDRGIQTLAGLFTLLEPQRYLWRLFFDPSAPQTGRVSEVTTLYGERIEKLADEGVSELMNLAGNHDELDISAMTAVWLGIVDSVMDWWIAHPEQSAEQMTDRCARLVLALFGGLPQ